MNRFAGYPAIVVAAMLVRVCAFYKEDTEVTQDSRHGKSVETTIIPNMQIDE